jgi:hypothetical protein
MASGKLGFLVSLLGLVALTLYGLRQRPAPELSLNGAQKDPVRWAGHDIVAGPVRVVEILADDGFVGRIGPTRAVFRGTSDVSPGQELVVRAAIDAGSGEFRLKAARIVPRGSAVFWGIIFGVSVATLLVVLLTVWRRFTATWGAGITRRDGEASWRIC